MRKTEYIDEIKEIVDWYQELDEGFMDINELMYKRQKLSGYAFNFNYLIVGPLAHEVEMKEAELETSIEQIRVQHIPKGVGASEIIGKANTEKQRKDLADALGNYKAAVGNQKSIFKVLESMNQHISYLKEELKYSRYSNYGN